MAEEEKSAGSGFGKLVYGTLKGNGINTEGMSFEEAVKKFNELGGTDNWHAKIMKREADEKEYRKQTQKEINKDLAKKQAKREIEEENLNEYLKATKKAKQEQNNIKPEIKEKVSGWSDSMKYAMLDRMQQDAKYYLGYGERADKNLWAGNPEDHIQYMQEIYSQLKNKPDWISEKDINNYKSQMLANGKPEKESTKQRVDKNTKEFMDKAKKGEIKPENSAPKEFKWNSNTNSYEYKGANVMESMIGKGLYEVDVAGEELIVSSLEEAKKQIDQMKAYEKKHNGYMYGEDKYI